MVFSHQMHFKCMLLFCFLQLINRELLVFLCVDLLNSVYFNWSCSLCHGCWLESITLYLEASAHCLRRDRALFPESALYSALLSEVCGVWPWSRCRWAPDILDAAPWSFAGATGDLCCPAFSAWTCSRPASSVPDHPARRSEGAGKGGEGWAEPKACAVRACWVTRVYLHSEVSFRLSAQRFGVVLPLHWCRQDILNKHSSIPIRWEELIALTYCILISRWAWTCRFSEPEPPWSHHSV